MSPFIPSSRSTLGKRAGVLTAVIALLAAMFTMAGGVSSASADPTGSISGTVDAAGSPNTALANAYVVLYTEGQQIAAQAPTDENGEFSFTGLAAGSYTLDFQRPDGSNYVEQWWGNQASYSSAVFFPLADGQALTGQNAVLAVGSTLSGSVSGAGSPNAPLAGSFVSLQQYGGGLVFVFANTDANGHFTISGIGPGTYVLQFSPPFTSTGYLSQWWQDESVESNAHAITIGTGQTLTGYDAVLQAEATISGTVSGADTGTGISGGSVEALQSDGTGSFANIGTDGTYTIHGLVPATYTLLFQPAYGLNYLSQYWNNQPTQGTANTISVTNGDVITGIDATLAVGATVSGHVTSAESPTVGLADASAFVIDSTGEYLQSATTDSDGNYSIVGIAPGTYRVEVQPPYGDSHAVQYWKNQPNLDKATPLTIAAGSSTTGIDAKLTAGATISGTVTDTGTPSAPIAGADVWAETTKGTFITEAFADENGNYTISNVPAGTVVVKFAGTEGGAYTPSYWQNASKLSAAKRITVAAGATVTGIDGTNAPAFMTPGKPKISGKAVVGSTITANPGKWKPMDEDTTFTYQWNRDGAAISGAVGSTYVPVNADAGHSLTVSVTGDHYDYNDVTATSAPTRVVTGGTLTAAIPQITGTPSRGSVLTAAPGSWGPGTVALTYHWSRDGTRIGGATNSTYTVTKADSGKQLTVTVTGTETGFTTASATSLPTAAAS
jgi:hypothetical protein